MALHRPSGSTITCCGPYIVSSCCRPTLRVTTQNQTESLVIPDSFVRGFLPCTISVLEAIKAVHKPHATAPTSPYDFKSEPSHYEMEIQVSGSELGPDFRRYNRITFQSLSCGGGGCRYEGDKEVHIPILCVVDSKEAQVACKTSSNFAREMGGFWQYVSARSK